MASYLNRAENIRSIILHPSSIRAQEWKVVARPVDSRAIHLGLVYKIVTRVDGIETTRMAREIRMESLTRLVTINIIEDGSGKKVLEIV